MDVADVVTGVRGNSVRVAAFLDVERGWTGDLLEESHLLPAAGAPPGRRAGRRPRCYRAPAQSATGPPVRPRAPLRSTSVMRPPPTSTPTPRPRRSAVPSKRRAPRVTVGGCMSTFYGDPPVAKSASSLTGGRARAPATRSTRGPRCRPSRGRAARYGVAQSRRGPTSSHPCSSSPQLPKIIPAARAPCHAAMAAHHTPRGVELDSAAWLVTASAAVTGPPGQGPRPTNGTLVGT